MPAVRAGLNLCTLGLWWNAEFRADVAGISIAGAFVTLDQHAFDHVEGGDGERCIWKEPFRITSICTPQGDALSVEGLHVEQGANLRTCKSALLHRLLWKVAAMRERQYRPGRAGISPQSGSFSTALLMLCAMEFLHGKA